MNSIIHASAQADFISYLIMLSNNAEKKICLRKVFEFVFVNKKTFCLLWFSSYFVQLQKPVDYSRKKLDSSFCISFAKTSYGNIMKLAQNNML